MRTHYCCDISVQQCWHIPSFSFQSFSFFFFFIHFYIYTDVRLYIQPLNSFLMYGAAVFSPLRRYQFCTSTEIPFHQTPTHVCAQLCSVATHVAVSPPIFFLLLFSMTALLHQHVFAAFLRVNYVVSEHFAVTTSEDLHMYTYI